jgi:peptide/nickel transport system permease protein
MLIIDIGEDREGDGTSLEGRFRFLQRKLLDSRVVLSGPDEKGNEPRPGVSEGSRNDFHFLFGSDDAGRDVLSRAIAGARVSLGIGLAAALASLLIGAFIGLAAGLGGRWMDVLLMRLTDLALAIPGIFVAIGLVAFFGQSILTLVLVLAGLGWMGTARIVRGQVLVLREREFVLAAGLLGVPAWRIAVRHLVPNLLPVLVSATVLQFANAVLAEAALGFLGLGVQPPTASWGNMMGEALGSLQRGWWIGLFPGAMLASVLVAAHSMAEDSPGP